MALSAYLHWEVEPGSGNDNNAGSFDPSQTAGMLTDGAATSATGTAPVFSSASYNFVAGDVGAFVYIASGTNWTPGWYKISSVASNQATLDATSGHVTLKDGTLSTSNGCATTASPSGATWTIDYSRQATAAFAYTDLVIGGTNTQLTSVANPFGKQQVGNVIQVTSGSGFTTGFYTITSVSTVTATMDRAVGTAASTGGNGNQGGALNTLGKLFTASAGTTIPTSGQIVWMVGTSTITSTLTFCVSSANYMKVSLRGYGTYRGDNVQATIQTATNSVNLLTFSSVVGFEFRNFILKNTAATTGYGAYASGTSDQIAFRNCVFNGFSIGVNGATTAFFYTIVLVGCEIKSCTSHGIQNEGFTYCLGCYIHGNTGDGVRSDGNNSSVVVCERTVCASNGTVGFNDKGASTVRSFILLNCVAYNNTGDGVAVTQGSNTQTLVAMNCIAYGNGGFGFNFPSVSSGGAPLSLSIQQNNAFGSNTSGARNTGAPIGVSDVTLTGDPFTSGSTGDFSLNSTAGAGAACKQAGWPTVIPG